MEEVCEVGSKKLPNNFRGCIAFLGKGVFLVISRFRKSLVMSTPKPDNFMQLF